MNFSAASSRAAVVTPGRALPWSRLRVRASTRPAAVIFSISSGDFWMIMLSTLVPRALQLGFELQRGERRADVVVDLVRRAGAIEAAQQALVLVPLDQGLCLFVVDLEALLDRLRLVVVALDQLRAVHVADALVLRRGEGPV